MGACSSKFLNEGSTPPKGEKNAMEMFPWKPLPLVDIYPVGHAVGENKHVIFCSDLFLFCLFLWTHQINIQNAEERCRR